MSSSLSSLRCTILESKSRLHYISSTEYNNNNYQQMKTLVPESPTNPSTTDTSTITPTHRTCTESKSNQAANGNTKISKGPKLEQHDVISGTERTPLHANKRTQTSLSDFKDDTIEDSFIQHILSHFRFIRGRPDVFYPQVIRTVFVLAIATTMVSRLIEPGAVQDIFRFSSGRFADFYCLVGVWATLRCLSGCGRMVWSMVTPNDHIFKQAGSWALITGCTNGLGKEYAVQLAAKGMNVILVSRNGQLLDELAREIGNEYGVRTMVIVMDFATEDNEAYESLADQIKGYDIGVLVNNVGVTVETQHYHLNTLKEVRDLIYVNMISLAKMCQIVLPDMAMRRRGIVINLSSGLGTHPVSYVSVYGASKAFVDMFSKSLQHEYKNRYITIQNVTPYFISTNMTKWVDKEFLIPDTKTFVTSALATVGRLDNTYGYWRHSLEGLLIRNLPEPLIFCVMKILKYKSDRLNERNQKTSLIENQARK